MGIAGNFVNALNPTSQSPGFDYLKQLTALRKQLDSGQIGVDEFLKQGQPLATQIAQEQLRLGASGQEGARIGDQLREAFNGADTGFKQDDPGIAAGGDRAAQSIKMNLPEKYQQQARDAKLPDNITPEQREAYKGIPNDIPYDSDRFKIEQEGIRQRTQADAVTAQQQPLYQNQADLQRQQDNQEGLAQRQNLEQTGVTNRGLLDTEGAQQKGLLDAQGLANKNSRSQGLTDLASLLAERDRRQFNLEVPNLAEQANMKGVFRSTGFGDSLSREYANLAADSNEKLRLQGINDRNANISDASAALDRQLGFNKEGVGQQVEGNQNGVVAQNNLGTQGLSSQQQWQGAGLQDLLGSQKASLDRQLGYQGAGLDRDFSIKDANKNFSQTVSLANLAQPQQSGKSGAETAATAAGLGINGAMAYSKIKGGK